MEKIVYGSGGYNAGAGDKNITERSSLTPVSLSPTITPAMLTVGAQGYSGTWQGFQSAGTIDQAAGFVSCEMTSAGYTVTLPSASAYGQGRTLTIEKLSTVAGRTLTIARSGSDTFSPGSKTSLQIPATWGKITLYCTGFVWVVVAGEMSDETVGRRRWEWSNALAHTSTSATVGWQMTYGDTGWREVTVADPMFGAEYAAADPNAKAWFRRQTNTVSFKFNRGAAPTHTANYKQILEIPVGWRYVVTSGSTVYALLASFPLAMQAGTGNALTAPYGIYQTSGYPYFLLNTSGWTSGSQTYTPLITWPTNDAWPSSLPGIAVGTIGTGV